MSEHLGQGSQARGPWAACGPPDVFVRPASLIESSHIIVVIAAFVILRPFLPSFAAREEIVCHNAARELHFCQNAALVLI